MLVVINGKNSIVDTAVAFVPCWASVHERFKGSVATHIPFAVEALLTDGCRWNNGNAETKTSSRGNPARYTFSRASMITNITDLGYLQQRPSKSNERMLNGAADLLTHIRAG